MPSHIDQSKWDKKYLSCTDAGSPCWLLKHFYHLLPVQGKCLDLACGLGANTLFLAEHGLDSHGWDNSKVALAKLNEFSSKKNVPVTTLLRDVEQYPPEKSSFDIIVVSQFLYRGIFPNLISALKPNGLLFYQTFHQNKLTNSGPSNTNFLLSRNELLTYLTELALVFYREDALNGDLTKGLRDCSYFIGQKKS